jgi:Cu2+-exporting ATPase
MDRPDTCFHCGEPLEASRVTVALQGQSRGFCCHGCSAASELISGLGLEAYYQYRQKPAERPEQVSPGGEPARWRALDSPDILATLTQRERRGSSVMLGIEGMTCPACGWLVSRALESLDGVAEVSLNSLTGRARVVFDSARVRLSSILERVEALGYRVDPIAGDGGDGAVAERRAHLKRLAVAGLGMMQVMMFAVALNAGAAQGMEASVRAYLRLVSLLVATPVMLYGGWPYFAGAFRAVRSGSLTMDVPVSAGLILAYAASVANTLRHRGEVYFDSVTIFFLTAARYVELIARRRCLAVSESLGRLLPLVAHRFDRELRLVDVPAASLARSDNIMVKAGEIVPADGIIRAGASRLDESLLTGEPLPVERKAGDTVVAGTLNLASPLELEVSAVGGQTVLSSIVALLRRAQAERPRGARMADLSAQRFLVRVLIGAAAVCLWWLWADPSRAFNATLAVLVVACPCALSLAPLIVNASTSAALARRGILVTRSDAIGELARATVVLFDKTGTLTEGSPTLTGCRARAGLEPEEMTDIASALEVGSEHPLAGAFRRAGQSMLTALDVIVTPGHGIEGSVSGTRYRLGAKRFALGIVGRSAEARARAGAAVAEECIALTDASGVLAEFTVADRVRAGASEAARALESAGLRLEISSGDAPARVAEVASACGIRDFAARRSAEQKLVRVCELIAAGSSVAAVGDGINDAPVLGGASVSIAMGRGSALALASADLIYMGRSLGNLPFAFTNARRAARVLKENLAWATAYNLAAIPIAALGWMPPWAAAIGMSSSSILIVLNSLRLLRDSPADQAPRTSAAPPAGLTAPSWAPEG